MDGDVKSPIADGSLSSPVGFGLAERCPSLAGPPGRYARRAPKRAGRSSTPRAIAGSCSRLRRARYHLPDFWLGQCRLGVGKYWLATALTRESS